MGIFNWLTEKKQFTHIFAIYSCPEPQNESELMHLAVQVLNKDKPGWNKNVDPAGKTGTVWITEPMISVNLEQKLREAFGDNVGNHFSESEIVKFKTEDGEGAVLLVSCKV